MIQQRICKQCGKTFNGGPRAYYCPSCRYERTKITNQLHKQRKKMGTIRKLGSIDKCGLCGKEYIVNSGLQRFCPDCQVVHALEHDRITGLEFYHGHKDNINPKRNEKRRIGLIKCHWCSKEFDPEGTAKKYCTDECRRNAINKMWLDNYYLRKGKDKED